MQIKRIEIYGYGKWVDQSFDLQEGVHLFLGANEAGKSTLMSFLHSILFGFPTRNSTLLRYEPYESSKYGGKIIAEDIRFGEIIIERIHGKVTGDVTVTLEDGTTGSDEMLDTILKGMTREMYQNIFSFSLSDIENVHQLNKNELSRYLLNVGAHGTEHYLELANNFQADADKLYRPSGRVLKLNEQLAILKKQESHLTELEKRNESYVGLIEASNEQNSEIEALEAKHKQLEAELAEITELKKEWHIFEEIKELEAEIEAIQLPYLREDGQYLLETYKKEHTEVNASLQEVCLEEQKLKEALSNSQIIENYQDNKETIDTFEKDLPEMIEQATQLRTLNNQRIENDQLLADLKAELQLEESTPSPTRFSSEEVETIEQWQETFAANEEQLQKVSQKLQALENKLQLENQKLDQYEATMWNKQEFSKVEKQLELEGPTKESKRTPLLFGGVALILVIFAVLTTNNLQWLLGIGGIAFALLSVISYRLQVDNTTETGEQTTDTFLTEQYDKQLVLKDEWRATLSAIDSMQAEYQEQIRQRDELIGFQKSIASNWQNILQNHELVDTFSFAQHPIIINKTNEYIDILEKNTQKKIEQQELEASLKMQIEPILLVISVENKEDILDKMATIRKYLSQLKTVLTEEQSKLDQLTSTRQTIKQLEQTKEALQDKSKHLIKEAGVKTEAEFFDLYKQKAERDQKKNRQAFLRENTKQFKDIQNLPTKEEISQIENKLKTAIEYNTTQNKEAVSRRANTQVSIENIEKDGTYAEALQNFENQKAITQNLVDEWVSDKLASGLIQRTLNQVTKDRFAEIIADAQHYFHLLTSGEYERIVFKEDELFVRHRNGSIVDVKVLSRGTSEPLYVAIRLAYILNTRDMVKLPIIMDDPFVNFDRTRQQNMYQLLNEIGQKVQIIYFTFDTEVLNYFSEEETTLLTHT